jgi:tetratricopeptide (TPR) repeat protein
MSEEIRSQLSQLRGLRVISRTSVVQFRDSTKDSKQIGGILSVSHILEGSVRKFENKVRINIRLIETGEGTVVGTFQYDRDLSDIFALQTEKSKTVIQSIRPKLLTFNADAFKDYGTTDIPAFEAYLKGRALLGKRDRGQMVEATAAFQDAIRLDPDYLLAHSGLIDTLGLRRSYGFLMDPGYFEESAASVVVLESSDSNLSEVLTSLGLDAAMKYNNDIAESYYLRALEANEQYVQAYLWLQSLYVSLMPRRTVEAVNLLEIARSIDPLSPIVLDQLVRAHTQAGNYQQAKKTLEDFLDRDPTSVLARSSLANHYRFLEGDFVSALLLYLELWNEQPEFKHATAIGHLFIELGRFDLAAQWLDKTAQIVPVLGPFFKLQWLVAQRRNLEILELADDPNAAKFPEIVLIYARLMQGDYQAARDTINKIPPRNLANGTRLKAGIDFWKGYIAREIGPEEDVALAIEQLKTYVQDLQVLGPADAAHTRVELHLLEGDNMAAIEALQIAFNMGERNFMSRLESFMFDRLRSYPEFQQLRKEIKLDFDKQNERLEEYLPLFQSEDIEGKTPYFQTPARL